MGDRAGKPSGAVGFLPVERRMAPACGRERPGAWPLEEWPKRGGSGRPRSCSGARSASRVIGHSKSGRREVGRGRPQKVQSGGLERAGRKRGLRRAHRPMWYLEPKWLRCFTACALARQAGAAPSSAERGCEQIARRTRKDCPTSGRAAEPSKECPTACRAAEPSKESPPEAGGGGLGVGEWSLEV